MNEHLTEQQLIDYQFKLASEAAQSEIRAHLDGCEACRRRLERLVRKFATLDLLREEVKASEDLLSRTVESAVRQRHSRRIWLYRIPALGTVAAAILAGFALLLVSHSRPTAPTSMLPTGMSEGTVSKNAPSRALAPDQGVAFTQNQAESAAARTADKSLTFRQSQPMSAGSTPAPDGARAFTRSRPAPAGVGGAGPAQLAERGTRGAAKSLRDEVEPAEASRTEEPPPFAPASAIELVVLPRRENVQLTIYNGADLTLVRERRNLTLKRGWNWLQFMWANTLIDPTSLALEPLEHKDVVQVQQLVFPPRLRELGRWLIHSEVGGQVPFELTYFTSGLAWRAFYMSTLSQDEKTMHLEGCVRISNASGEDYEDARTRLVVGRVHLLDQIAELARREYSYGSPLPSRRLRGRLSGGAGDAYDYRLGWDDRATKLLTDGLNRKDIRKEGLSEYFLYTIEGTETIPNQWGKRLLSFETDEIPVTSLYKYDEERWGTEPIRFLSFANDPNHKLGQTPLPDGTVRVYAQADGEGHLSYAGAMAVKYIPVGEQVELNLGPARLVEIKPALMDCRTEGYLFDNKGNVSGWDEVRVWRIEVANTRSLPVEVEVTRGFGTPYWSLTSANPDVSYSKHDATHARFKLTVEPRGKRVFEYTVTTFHGVRQEAFLKVKQP